MAIASNPSSASRSKHIDDKFHFIEGLVRAGKIRNFLTKALCRKKFMMYRATLMDLA